MSPHSIDAEQACLGSCLVDDTAYATISERLRGMGDFYRQGHQQIWYAMGELARMGKAIDLITVSNQLRQNGALEDAGGVAYIDSLVSIVQSSANVSHYADIVADRAFERRLQSAGRSIAALAADLELPPQAKLERASHVLNQAIAGVARAQAVHLRDAAEELGRQLEEQARREEAGLAQAADGGISTGFGKLDEVIGGVLPGELTIVAGRPAMGKTAFGLALCRAFSGHGPVYLWTSEMTRLKIARRFAAMEYDLAPKKVTAQLAAGLAELAPNIWVDDERGLTVGRLAAKVAGFKLRHPDMAALVVDYLSNLSPDPSDYKEVSRASRKLLDLSSQLDIPIIALQQLSRKVEDRPDKRPMLSDLRESGQIEQDASVVLMLHREHYYKRSADPNLAECWVRKSRDGEAGRAIKLHWHGPSTRFSDWTDKHVEGIKPSSICCTPDDPHDEFETRANRAFDAVAMEEIPL